MNRFYRNPYNWFLLVLVLLNLLPVLAPVFLVWGEQHVFFKNFAKVIYLVYSFTCHQFAHRSLHIHDTQCAWCARDMGIWGGMLIAGLLAYGGRLKPIKWYWLIVFTIPIAVDAGFQTIATFLEIPAVGPVGSPIYISNNFTRFITGSIFGIGLSLWLSTYLWDGFTDGRILQASNNIIGKISSYVKENILRSFIFAIGTMLIGYIIFVQLWAASSSYNLPSDWLDSAVKTPSEDFYVRRENAICPTTSTDLFNLECLFGSQ